MMQNKLKTSAIAGVILLTYGFIISTFTESINIDLASAYKFTPYSIITTLISFALIIVFYNGFIILGKVHKVNLLKTMSIIMILSAIILPISSTLILTIIDFESIQTEVFNKAGVDNMEDLQIKLQTSELDQTEYLEMILGSLSERVKWILLLYLIYAVVYGVITILLGVSQLKLKDEVRYAKPAGILNIIAGATYFIFVGFLIRYVAQIIEILLLFNESNKSQEKTTNKVIKA